MQASTVKTNHQMGTRRFVLILCLTLNMMDAIKQCYVAGGHLTNIPKVSVYSGVVSLRGLRMVAFLPELNGLDLWATNIGNAYLEAKTSELLFIVAGPEFGDLEGHMLVIYKALYGLCSSGLRWHEHFSACLRDMGFFPCKAEPDIWMRRVDNHYVMSTLQHT
jgi:hypothetical protein